MKIIENNPSVIEEQLEQLVESPALLQKLLLQLLPQATDDDILEINEIPVTGGRQSRSILKRQGGSSRGKDF